jgi:hypothetical protein
MRCWVEQHECVECLEDADCFGPGGTAFCDLQTHTCVQGCQDNGDCGWNMVCDTTQDPAICVQCYSGDTSVCDDMNLVCDDTQKICVECVQDADCQDAVLGHCLPDENICVECYEDAHCAANETCDLDSYTCLASTGRGLCEPCDDNGQCGAAGDLCLEFRLPTGELVDQGCGQACGTGSGPCPDGYRCAQQGQTMQCVPHNAEEVPTCAGMRAMGTPCDGWDANCGVEGVNDGTCLTENGMNWACTVACSADAVIPMCIENWECFSLGGWLEVCRPQ